MNNDEVQKTRKVKKDEFKKLLENDGKSLNIPSPGDLIKGKVLSISKNEVRLDIEGMTTGLVRSRELYNDLDEYSNLKEGDIVEATILEIDNENGEMELSFKVAGQQKTWDQLHQALKDKNIIKATIKEANKGGLIVKIFSTNAFLPVSQLAPEHYPKVQGGDKSKILEKLKRLINEEISVKIINISEKEEIIIVSEKEAIAELQNKIISNFNKNDIVEGSITAITDFGAFIKIDKKIPDTGEEENVNFAEGLIHISEVAWQKIENLKDYLKEGQRVKAKIINIDGTKIFLSIKQLSDDPWKKIEKKYSLGQMIKGQIIKINPYGLLVKIEDDIQGLAHISELSDQNIKSIKEIGDIAKIGDKKEFMIVSIDCDNHRIGLSLKGLEPEVKEDKVEKKKEDKKEKKED